MIIKELIKHLEIEKEQRDKTAMSPTDAGKCQRQVYYSLINAPKDNTTAQEQLIFDVGNAIHEKLQVHFNNMGIQLKEEYRIENGYLDMPIHAYVDSICIINKETYIIEIKSHKEWNYGNKCYLVEPKKEHIAQIQMYMHFTGIKKGILLYMNKNTSELKEFIIKYDPKHIGEILNELFDTWQNAQKKVEPKRNKLYVPVSYPCKYCKYSNYCYRDYSREILKDD